MISRKQNPWIKSILDPKAAQAQKDLLLAMSRKAAELLADQKFVEYKKLYEDYHAMEMENLLLLNEQDPIKYAFKVRQVIDTLKAYRLLISSIEENAQISTEEVK